MEFSIDDTDISIIMEFLKLMKKGGSTSTGKIAQKLFKPATRIETKRKENFIRSRIAKLEMYGLIETEPQTTIDRHGHELRTNVHQLLVPIVNYKNGKLTLNTQGYRITVQKQSSQGS